MSRHVVVDGQLRHLSGWKKAPPRFGDPHLGDGFGMTPQQKGFLIGGPVVSLRSIISPIKDQLDIGSCTANAWAGQVEAVRRKLGLPPMNASRLFIYGGERGLEGIPLSEDSGAYIHDGGLFLEKSGVCPEEMWPYITSKFSVNPPQPCWIEAAKHVALRWYTLSSVDWIKACITLGFPVVIGFQVPQSFTTETVKTGQLNMPLPNEPFVGGHAVLIVGYDDTWINDVGNIGAFDCANSWGPNVMDAGFFKMPYAYHTQLLASDACAMHAEAA